MDSYSPSALDLYLKLQGSLHWVYCSKLSMPWQFTQCSNSCGHCQGGSFEWWMF